MGYGSQAICQLRDFFCQSLATLARSSASELFDAVEPAMRVQTGDRKLQSESIRPRKRLPPLLVSMEQIKPPRIDWLGTSFGLNRRALNFWVKNGFMVVHVRQSANDVTGEHNAILLREVSANVEWRQSESHSRKSGWVHDMAKEMRKRFIRLLAIPPFNSFDTSMCLSLLGKGMANVAEDVRRLHGAESKQNQHATLHDGADESISLSDEAHPSRLTTHDLKRLKFYLRGMADHTVAADVLSIIAADILYSDVPIVELTELQAAILVGVSLQQRPVDSVSSELKLSPAHLLSLYSKTARKIVLHCFPHVPERDP